MHQIRRHFAHIFHPILGDRPHGCNKQNKLWKEHYDMESMLLHAHSLTFQHPQTSESIHIKANVQPVFNEVLDILSVPDGIL
jgi:tRNA pseudouridine65 synthase